jgi:hypothetical protein
MGIVSQSKLFELDGDAAVRIRHGSSHRSEWSRPYTLVHVVAVTFARRSAIDLALFPIRVYG